MTVSEKLPNNSPRRVVQYIYRNSIVCFREQKIFCFENSVFLTLSLGMCGGVGEDLRQGIWACIHSSRIMYFLECVYVESLHVHLGGE